MQFCSKNKNMLKQLKNLDVLGADALGQPVLFPGHVFSCVPTLGTGWRQAGPH